MSTGYKASNTRETFGWSAYPVATGGGGDHQREITLLIEGSAMLCCTPTRQNKRSGSWARYWSSRMIDGLLPK